MSFRSSFRLRVPFAGRWALLLILAFLAFAYGRPFAWGVAVRSPAVVAYLCGEGASPALVLRSELEPPPEGPHHRARIAEWFACRDGDHRITTDLAFHDRVVWAGGAALFLVLLALSFAARLVWRVLFARRMGPDGEARPSPVGRVWAALSGSAQLRVKAAAFAAGVGFAAAILPTAIALQNLHRIPGAAALICESGELSPYGYGIQRAFGSSRPGRQIACLDQDGEPMIDEARHERVAKIVVGLCWSALGLAFYPLGLAIFRDGRWRR